MPWRKGETFEDRLWKRIDKEGPNGCWVWRGGLKSNGYGQISLGGRDGRKTMYTHRVVWELTNGPVPDGLDLDHLCRNRCCCNPDHLEPVSRRVNLLRGQTIPADEAAKTHCKNGHEFTPENTHLNTKGHRGCRACHAGVERRRRAARRAIAG